MESYANIEYNDGDDRLWSHKEVEAGVEHYRKGEPVMEDQEAEAQGEAAVDKQENDPGV